MQFKYLKALNFVPLISYLSGDTKGRQPVQNPIPGVNGGQGA